MGGHQNILFAGRSRYVTTDNVLDIWKLVMILRKPTSQSLTTTIDGKERNGNKGPLPTPRSFLPYISFSIHSFFFPNFDHSESFDRLLLSMRLSAFPSFDVSGLCDTCQVFFISSNFLTPFIHLPFQALFLFLFWRCAKITMLTD